MMSRKTMNRDKSDFPTMLTIKARLKSFDEDNLSSQQEICGILDEIRSIGMVEEAILTVPEPTIIDVTNW